MSKLEHTRKPNNIYDRTVFAMENLLISRSDLFRDFINVISRKGHDAGWASPIHLVDHYAQPIGFPVEYGSSRGGIFDHEILSRLFDYCINPPSSQR